MLCKQFHKKIACGTLAAALVLSSLPATALANQRTDAVMDATEVQEALSGYSPSFTNGDIALPNGLVAENDGLKITDGAPKQVAGAAKSDGWEKASKKVDYTVKGLAFVSKDAKKVGDYGSSFFDIIRGCATGNFAEAFFGGTHLLNLVGVLPGEGGGPSNAELMGEMKDLKLLVEGMSSRLDESAKQTYQNRLSVFDNAVGALGIESSTVSQMLSKAYDLAVERGLIDANGNPGEEQPDEPKEPQLPAEPVAPALPPKPELDEATLPDEPQRPASGNEDLVEDFDEGAYAARHAQWERECEQAREEHELAVRNWEAECDRLNAEHEKDVADWKAECERLTAEHDAAVADYREKMDEQEKAGKDIDTILVRIMREEDAKGTRAFRNVSGHINDLRRDFEIVAVECAKSEASSPFHAFDSYWNLYFNWETQGYYLRQAYRTRAEFALKRAYALLAIYYGFDEDPDDSAAAQPLSEAMRDALLGIEALPAGTDPATIDPDGSYSVKCLVNGKTATKGGPHFFAEGSLFTEKEAETYKSRLHGRNVKEDLKLAGLYSPRMDGQWPKCPDGKSWGPVAGIAVRAEKKDAENAFWRIFLTNYHYYWATVMSWDGSMRTVKTGDDEGKCRGFSPAYHCLGGQTYWWFEMR